MVQVRLVIKVLAGCLTIIGSLTFMIRMEPDEAAEGPILRPVARAGFVQTSCDLGLEKMTALLLLEV